MLRQVLTDESCYDIILDIGMPVEHKGNRYNWYVSSDFDATLPEMSSAEWYR
jgi:hypothetical protein